MKFVLTSTGRSVEQVLRSWGYSPNNSRSDQPNYVRRVRPGQSWPRYHLYLNEQAGNLCCELHVDQKAETRHYNPIHAHNGEYDGPLVEQEVNRLKQSL
ncbi:MAG: hypothetical protein V1846_01825 [Candidatus Komeilibacteria bacterium]